MPDVKAGDRLRIKASDWNDTLRTNEAFRMGELGNSAPYTRNTQSPVVIPVMTPVDIQIGHVFSALVPFNAPERVEGLHAADAEVRNELFFANQLQLRALAAYPPATPPDDGGGHPGDVPKVSAPTDNWQPTPMFAIALEEGKANDFVNCAVAGIAATHVDVTEDTQLYRAVSPKSTTASSKTLDLSPVGSGYLLWREEGIGEAKRAVVQIGPNQPPVVYPVAMSCENGEDIEEAIDAGDFDNLPEPSYTIHIGVAEDEGVVQSHSITGQNVTISPHYWRRPRGLISIKPATAGFGIYDTWLKRFSLLWCNEEIYSGLPEGGLEYQVLNRRSGGVEWGWMRWH